MQTHAAWEVKTGYVGTLTLMVPYTSLTDPCLVVLDELWLSIGPKEVGGDGLPDKVSTAPVWPQLLLVPLC